MSDTVTHIAPLWIWTSDKAPASWHFITIGGAAGEAISAHEAMRRLELGGGRGFGSVKVRARIGGSEWHTSVFPAKTQGGYLLPIKAAVRKAEGLVADDLAEITLELL